MGIIQDEKQRAYVQHNLRTPLTVIKGSVDMLEQYSGTNVISLEKEKQILMRIQEQISRMEQFLLEL
ncbi:histidine kinase dimerization/phospho-acceptor domain-containing protein [Anaerostipes hominis (ex Lee et al. 2021)]|jgi:K+-sensing histidine kinase KdpD|uniref:histidine kinase dimerization/phospho-acceptor domain-containing protein n=1 Tax=Anaerostipes hominis (ex Lee et al. 2021) TaxID=2025494 RepID=UPI0022E759C3|nr:histidine kinase dimerization/phospho-acceptor domain-containing protein [Anaerostipes hominis (ex Lee et al. 2021)]